MTAPVKSIVQPGTGKRFKLGRQEPKVIYPHLHLSNYLLRTLPPAPVLVDYSVAPAAWLAKVLGNDELGDCLDAASFHVGGMLLANAGEDIPFSLNDVINFYSLTAGYVRGDASTDVGGTWQQTLAYWQSNGLVPNNHKIDGYASVGASDSEECHTAMWLFGNVVMGMALPDEWVSPMPSGNGFVWDVAGPPNPQNGHAVCGVASSMKDGITVDSWGYKGLITWAAIAKYCAPTNSGEIYTVLSRDAINTAMGVAPSGFSFTALDSDLSHLASHHHPSPSRIS